MSSADFKTTLKEARDAIKNKDFRTSLKLCKAVLKEDKENYMALVFLGVSLQETGPADQAPKAFKKAIDTNPTNILAWNGLMSYYEKYNTAESNNHLLDVYASMICLDMEETKQKTYFDKLVQLSSESHDPNIVANAFYKVLKNLTNSDLAAKALNHLISFLSRIENITDDLLKMFEEVLKMKLHNPKETTYDQYAEYLKLLNKQNKYKELLEESLMMSTIFKEDKISLECFCKAYVSLAVEEENVDSYKRIAEEILNKLENLNSQSLLGQLLKGLLLFKSNKPVESCVLVESVCAGRPGMLHAWLLLCSIYLRLELYDYGVEAAIKVDHLLQTLTNSNLKCRELVNSYLLKFYCHSANLETLTKGLNFCNNLLEKKTDMNCDVAKVLILTNLSKFKDAIDLLGKIKNEGLDEAAFVLLESNILHKEGELVQALKILEKTIYESREYWISLGTLYWELEKYEKSLVPFLKATKLDPNSYICYLKLGNYYNKFNDLQKARRCYEKSFQIKKDQESGTELSKIYRILKLWDMNQTLLLSLTEKPINSNNQWAFLQLGLHYLENEEFDKAIYTLRSLVRREPENCHFWETLADAYMARGAYNSALKCYQKSIDFGQDPLYPCLQVANIRKLLFQYDEAKIDFKNLLSTNKKYIPALKGIAETFINQAFQYRKKVLLGLARDCAQEAFDYITVAIEQNSNLSCLWKIAADSCILIAQLPQKYSCLLVGSAFIDGDNSQGRTIIEQNDLFTLAARCLCKALIAIEDNTLILHDLATCYFSHSKYTNDKTEEMELLKKAQATIEYCISINPNYWQHWNLLGVVSFFNESKNFALSQHSFIKAVTLDHNSTISWCNLGTLYLYLENYKLANKAFSQAQRTDPNYINSWVGQALIAENFGHHDAMDLFRHSTLLGHLQESALGYGYMVCRTLLENSPHTITYAIHNMHAVPVACDALTWYIDFNSENACAWNMLGILKERMGLKLDATSAFKRAVSLVDNSDRDKTYINYGRMLMKLGKHSEAVEMFKHVKEATFNSVSGLALALFKDEKYEESYESYESALHWMTEEQHLQSDLLVALASMSFLFQSTESSKTLLFQSIQLKPRSPWGLYATLSLALLYDDVNLATLVLREFDELIQKKECLRHISILTAYTYLIQENNSKAIKEVSRLVHQYPDQGYLWLILSYVLATIKEKYLFAPGAAKCAYHAMKLGQSQMDFTKVLSNLSLASYLAGNTIDALKAAQHAIHTYPNIAESWSLLIASLQALKGKKQQSFKIKEKIDHLQMFLNPTKELNTWLNTVKSAC